MRRGHDLVILDLVDGNVKLALFRSNSQPGIGAKLKTD